MIRSVATKILQNWLLTYFPLRISSYSNAYWHFVLVTVPLRGACSFTFFSNLKASYCEVVLPCHVLFQTTSASILVATCHRYSHQCRSEKTKMSSWSSATAADATRFRGCGSRRTDPRRVNASNRYGDGRIFLCWRRHNPPEIISRSTSSFGLYNNRRCKPVVVFNAAPANVIVSPRQCSI